MCVYGVRVIAFVVCGIAGSLKLKCLRTVAQKLTLHDTEVHVMHPSFLALGWSFHVEKHVCQLLKH